MMETYAHETELRTYLGRKFNRNLSVLPLDVSFTDELGLDSLGYLELIVQIENQFDVYFPPEEFGQAHTLRHVLEALDAPARRAVS